MTIKYSILSSIVLLLGVSIAHAAPVQLSSNQMDVVSAGAGTSIGGVASATGLFPVSAAYTGVSAGAVGGVGYGVAVAFGSNANVSTSSSAGGVALAGTGQSFGIGRLAYSIRVVAFR